MNKIPDFQILICLIKIWDHKEGISLLDEPDDALMITECENISIVESYKKLIGTAELKFPRGTVVRKTITPKNAEEVANSKYLDASIESSGVVLEVRKKVSELAKTSHFKVGQRIRIYLGYTDDPNIAKMAKAGNMDASSSIFMSKENRLRYEQCKYLSKKALHNMFDGYITRISVDDPIELSCENLAHKLKEVTCPNVSLKKKATVNDFLSDNGRFKMLKGTGLSLHPVTEQQVFDLGSVSLTTDLTVADVLTEWEKYGLHAFVTEYDGKPVIAIGRTYFHNAKDDSVIRMTGESVKGIEIRFNEHVANNGLSVSQTDKKYLAVEAEGIGADDKFYHITVLRNPKYNPNDKTTGSPYRVVNESKISKKAMKLGITPLCKSTDRVSMDLYTKIPYHSRKIPCSRDQLMEEAIKYLESYNANGVDGTLTLFGDLHLHTGVKVHLIDNLHPGKNGEYLVEEINTTFGTGGYRQTIRLPYCIKLDKDKGDK